MNKQSTHQDLREQCLALLRAAGVELDDNSSAVIDNFFSKDAHVSLHDIESHLRDNGLPLDIAQTRRTMQLLVDYGFASEKQFPGGRTLYEHLHLGEHHDHLYCQRCGEIVEFCSPELEALQLQAARENGFHAFSHRLVIHGLCDKCFGGPSRGVLPLASVQAGGLFRIARVGHGGGGFLFGGGRRRMAEHGIVAGAEGEVLSNQGTMVVVQLGGARLALRHGQTRRILVELLN